MSYTQLIGASELSCFEQSQDAFAYSTEEVEETIYQGQGGFEFYFSVPSLDGMEIAKPQVITDDEKICDISWRLDKTELFCEDASSGKFYSHRYVVNVVTTVWADSGGCNIDVIIESPGETHWLKTVEYSYITVY